MADKIRIKPVYCKNCGVYLADCRTGTETKCPDCNTWTKTEEGGKRK